MQTTHSKTILGSIAALLIVPVLGLAEESGVASAQSAAAGANGSSWLIVAAAATLVMFIGLVARELGFSHSRNSVNVIMKALLTLSIAFIAYLFIGFTLMYVAPMEDGLWWSQIGSESPFWSFWLLQATFVALAAAICAGATGERVRFGGYLVVMTLFCALVFPLLAQFTWGSQAQAFGVASSVGWLEQFGFHDFGGGVVIHAMGGAFALAGALALGPRDGRYSSDGSPRVLPGQSLPLAATGVFLLWIGWFGLVLGQAFVRGLEADAVGRIAVNLCVSAGFAAVIATGVTWGLRSRPDASATLNGALAGLVAISAGADLLSPAIAAAVGAVAALLMLGASVILEKWHIDDVVGAAPVHLVGGVIGALAVAVANPALLGIQALGAVFISGVAFALGFLVFKSLDLSLGVRASEEEQATGLDFSQHAATAYTESFESHDV